MANSVTETDNDSLIGYYFRINYKIHTIISAGIPTYGNKDLYELLINPLNIAVIIENLGICIIFIRHLGLQSQYIKNYLEKNPDKNNEDKKSDCSIIIFDKNWDTSKWNIKEICDARWNDYDGLSINEIKREYNNCTFLNPPITFLEAISWGTNDKYNNNQRILEL